MPAVVFLIGFIVRAGAWAVVPNCSTVFVSTNVQYPMHIGVLVRLTRYGQCGGTMKQNGHRLSAAHRWIWLKYLFCHAGGGGSPCWRAPGQLRLAILAALPSGGHEGGIALLARAVAPKRVSNCCCTPSHLGDNVASFATPKAEPCGQGLNETAMQRNIWQNIFIGHQVRERMPIRAGQSFEQPGQFSGW